MCCHLAQVQRISYHFVIVLDSDWPVTGSYKWQGGAATQIYLVWFYLFSDGDRDFWGGGTWCPETIRPGDNVPPETIYPKTMCPGENLQLETICPGRQHALETIRPRDNMPWHNMPQRLHAPGHNVPWRQCGPGDNVPQETICLGRPCAGAPEAYPFLPHLNPRLKLERVSVNVNWHTNM